MLERHVSHQGDTLIEVMFAMAVFALVSVTSMAVMNRGMGTAQQSLEVSLVRQEMNTQAEAIRYINSSYVASLGGGSSAIASKWNAIKSLAVNSTQIVSYSDLINHCSPSDHVGKFVIDTRHNMQIISAASYFKSPDTYSRLVYDDSGDLSSAQGIWVQAVIIPASSDRRTPSYVDFHIRSCWASINGGQVPNTLGTIVRLYEPL